jgi:hypothetical protein
MKPKKQTAPPSRVYIGFYVTPEIHKALRLMAVENDTSVSHMMRRMAEAKAMEDGKKPARK